MEKLEKHFFENLPLIIKARFLFSGSIFYDKTQITSTMNCFMLKKHQYTRPTVYIREFENILV